MWLSSSSDNNKIESDIEECYDLNIKTTVENENFIILNNNDSIIDNGNIYPIDIRSK